MANRLSVCLLTRNEGRNIERVIRSVAGVADEVVVADAGSTDRTAEMARGLGAVVVPFSWDDDFSEGRNVALGRASGGWVLWLNPDEELLPDGLEEVRGRIDAAAGDVFGYLARVRSVPRGERPDQFTESQDLRLFRGRPDLHYVGRLHPGFPPEFARTVESEGQRVQTSAISIKHHAYLSTLDESKLRWAARLLERELADRPGQLHYAIEYGRTLLLLKDPKGHEVIAGAVDQVWPAVGSATPPSPDVQILLEYALTTPPGVNRSRLSAMQAVELVGRWFPDSPPLLWAIAEASFRARRFDASATLLERLVHLGASGSYDPSRPFDPRIVGSWASLNLGHCLRALGRPDEARRRFEPLLLDADFAGQAAKALEELETGRAGGG